jgi:hypothetical protein
MERSAAALCNGASCLFLKTLWLAYLQGILLKSEILQQAITFPILILIHITSQKSQNAVTLQINSEHGVGKLQVLMVTFLTNTDCVGIIQTFIFNPGDT